MEALLDCARATWSPGIGDRTAVGWITVLAYALAAMLAARLAAGRVSGPASGPASGRGARAERVFWTLAALYLAFLAVNKQLDLQSFLTAAGRCAAKAQGWYAERRGVQRALIEGLVAASLLAGLLLLLLLRRTLARTFLSLLGLMVITAWVLVRAAGFHHVDSLLVTRIAGLRVNWLAELGGIALFVAGALWARRARRRPG